MALQRKQDYATINRLIALAVNGLQLMVDQKRHLFCYKLKKTDQGMVQEGISQRYTAMTLMGLLRLKRAGVESSIDTKPIFEALFSDLNWVDNIGDLGLLLWLCSLAAPERMIEIESRINIATALVRYTDAQKRRTMELAWFLSGLCHSSLALPRKLIQWRVLADQTYNLLIENQGRSGLFGHLSRSKGLTGWFRGRIGSFADQVYPIYAMALFSKAFQNEDARSRALACGQTICELQGLQGQWWWHYNSSNGCVVEGYPVFSVHQHGMAPMMLFALAEATQRDFSAWIYRGLEWIYGKNELGFDMEDVKASLIWRSMFRSSAKFQNYWYAAFNRVNPVATEPGDDLKVLFECRPYELGWLLYAFAEQGQQNRTGRNPFSLSVANRQPSGT